jgi:hypothetical protein
MVIATYRFARPRPSPRHRCTFSRSVHHCTPCYPWRAAHNETFAAPSPYMLAFSPVVYPSAHFLPALLLPYSPLRNPHITHLSRFVRIPPVRFLRLAALDISSVHPTERRIRIYNPPPCSPARWSRSASSPSALSRRVNTISYFCALHTVPM